MHNIANSLPVIRIRAKKMAKNTSGPASHLMSTMYMKATSRMITSPLQDYTAYKLFVHAQCTCISYSHKQSRPYHSEVLVDTHNKLPDCSQYTLSPARHSTRIQHIRKCKGVSTDSITNYHNDLCVLNVQKLYSSQLSVHKRLHTDIEEDISEAVVWCHVG